MLYFLIIYASCTTEGQLDAQSEMLQLRQHQETESPREKNPHRHGENKLTPHRVLGIDPITFFLV